MDDAMNGANDEKRGLQHRRAWDLIPWVVNGSADAGERGLVDAHVAACADCAAELAFQRTLHAAIGAEAPAVEPNPEPALQRFWERVDAAAAHGGAAAAGVTDGPGRPRTGRRENAVRWLTAAVVVQAIALGALGGMLFERPRAAPYETLSRSAAVPAAATIRLVPAPQLALGGLGALLARHGVELVTASADASHFGLVLRAGNRAGLADTLAGLRAEPGVLLAEPI